MVAVEQAHHMGCEADHFDTLEPTATDFKLMENDASQATLNSVRLDEDEAQSTAR